MRKKTAPRSPRSGGKSWRGAARTLRTWLLPLGIASALVALAAGIIIVVALKYAQAKPPDYEALLPQQASPMPDTAADVTAAPADVTAAPADGGGAKAKEAATGTALQMAAPQVAMPQKAARAVPQSMQTDRPTGQPTGQQTDRHTRLKPDKAGGRGTIVIVIDDAGYKLHELDAFLKLPFPLTIAVLPGLAESAESARRILAAGKELILHQPMDALNGQNPGPSAVRLGMSAAEAKAVVQRNLDALPGVKGMNNHMGSAVSADTNLLKAIIALAKERGIYYLDSRTTDKTVAHEVSAALTLRLWERNVFLDNGDSRAYVLRALEDGRDIAREKGTAILIGHLWSAELAQTLMDVYPQLIEEGYTLNSISRIMMEEAEEEAKPYASPGH